MELVYLWVEEYKNIIGQGFNFSPRFECSYDEKKEELAINENKDYVSIFPENINVTAIVGENGSGKSSIYELLINLLYKEKPILNKKIKAFLITKESDSNKFCIYTSIKLKKFINKYKDILILKESEDDKNFLLLLDFVFSEWKINNSSKNYKINFALEPSRILLNKTLRNKIDINSFDSNIKNFGFFGYMFLKNKNIENNFIKKLNVLENVEIRARDEKGKRTSEFTKLITKYENDINNIISNFYQLKNHNLSTGSGLENFDSYFNKFNIDNIDKLYINNLYLLFSLYNFEMKFGNKFSFKDLSSGQTTLLSYIGYISRYIEYCIYEQKKSLTIIIDECETSLHPNWQKESVKFFIDAIKSGIEDDFKINLIFTSYSPFILSDIPKENVIFLEKDKETGLCKNATKDIDIKTFGANIHTLLSNGFFMSDGLMGEFAKSKINEIKKFYEIVKFLEPKNKKYKRILKILYLFKIKKFKHIKSIIGEKFLQTIIKNYLDELEEIFDKKNYKKNKMKELLEQFEIEEIQKYLDEKK